MAKTIARTRRRLTPTPVITEKTITAKDLLLRIRQVILEEPKRVDMRDWLLRFKGERFFRRWTNDAPVPNPSCGTVGCIAGWGMVLLRGEAKARTDGYGASSVLGGLLRINKLEGMWVTDLFDAVDDLVGNPGTVRYARSVAARIDRYLEDHADVLAKRVIDVASLTYSEKG